jgi:hypothetical protein
MHLAPHTLPLFAIIVAIFLGPFALDFGLTRYLAKRDHKRAIRERLRNI